MSYYSFLQFVSSHNRVWEPFTLPSTAVGHSFSSCKSTTRETHYYWWMSTVSGVFAILTNFALHFLYSTVTQVSSRSVSRSGIDELYIHVRICEIMPNHFPDHVSNIHSTSSLTHSVVSFTYLFQSGGLKWNFMFFFFFLSLIMVLVCISLITNEIEHLFMSLGIQMS